MTGDVEDFVSRMRAILPRGWIADVAPVSNAVLAAIAAAWQAIYYLFSTAALLTRIQTSTGPFLDMISSDFFGSGLVRKSGEDDAVFVGRIQSEILRPRATRNALTSALFDLTSRLPLVIEPARPADTGGYCLGGVGYSTAGAWGSLALDHTCFVTAYRPAGRGIADVAGFGTGGPLVYGNIDMVATPVSDLDISSAVAAILPLGCTAWLRISD